MDKLRAKKHHCYQNKPFEPKSHASHVTWWHFIAPFCPRDVILSIMIMEVPSFIISFHESWETFGLGGKWFWLFRHLVRDRQIAWWWWWWEHSEMIYDVFKSLLFKAWSCEVCPTQARDKRMQSHNHQSHPAQPSPQLPGLVPHLLHQCVVLHDDRILHVAPGSVFSTSTDSLMSVFWQQIKACLQLNQGCKVSRLQTLTQDGFH